jgi:hypothetical protein
MASNIAKAGNGSTALSTDLVAGLRAGIAESRASTPIAGGKPLLRLLKNGVWVFGQSDDPVQEGSSWAINPLSIGHGWSCWSNHPPALKRKNELLGEVMAPITSHKPPRPDDIQGFPFTEQRIFELRCLDGDDAGTEVLYKTSSVGGMRAVDTMLAKLVEQLGTDPSHPVAIVQLESDSYNHSQYGQTFVPLIEIVGWADMSGEQAETSEASEDEAPAPVSAKPAKAAGKASLKAVPADAAAPAAASTRAGAAPRRQRPAARA